MLAHSAPPACNAQGVEHDSAKGVRQGPTNGVEEQGAAKGGP